MSGLSRRKLARALEGLDARARVLLSLAHLDGLDPAEIASLFAATPARVAREIASAERALRRSLSPAACPERRRRA